MKSPQTYNRPEEPKKTRRERRKQRRREVKFASSLDKIKARRDAANRLEAARLGRLLPGEE